MIIEYFDKESNFESQVKRIEVDVNELVREAIAGWVDSKPDSIELINLDL